MTRHFGDERFKILILSTYEGTDANAVRDYLLTLKGGPTPRKGGPAVAGATGAN